MTDTLDQKLSASEARAFREYQAFEQSQTPPWNRIQFDDWLIAKPRGQEHWNDYLARLNAERRKATPPVSQ